MTKTIAGTRRVKALQDTYVDHVYRAAGSTFSYSGDPAPGIIAEPTGREVEPEPEFDEPKPPKGRAAVVESKPKRRGRPRDADLLN